MDIMLFLVMVRCEDFGAFAGGCKAKGKDNGKEVQGQVAQTKSNERDSKGSEVA